MWTTKNRVRYHRDQLRYPSDVTEEEWGVIHWSQLKDSPTLCVRFAGSRDGAGGDV
jgi:hypothetical protein